MPVICSSAGDKYVVSEIEDYLAEALHRMITTAALNED